jgi:uncharacterized membrane protein YedE/YeeE
MENFTPLTATVGGILIGLSAVTLMLLNGRIAGISGITAGLLARGTGGPDRWWRLAFVASLIATPPLLAYLSGVRPDITYVSSVPLMIAAGLIVGFGTVIGNGCTSGHGVCGMARLSARSIIATAVFMSSGIAVTFLVRHVLGGG